jgi:hypothetical protein
VRADFARLLDELARAGLSGPPASDAAVEVRATYERWARGASLLPGPTSRAAGPPHRSEVARR